MMSITKQDDLYSFDVPETVHHSSGDTIYKIVLQVAPKELAENNYQVRFIQKQIDLKNLQNIENLGKKSSVC